MMRRFVAPSDVAASTNSRSRSDMTWPRTTRAIGAQVNSTMTASVMPRLGPASDTSEMANSSCGRHRVVSISQFRTTSTLPRRKPATSPTSVPMPMLHTVATAPTNSEMRAP